MISVHCWYKARALPTITLNLVTGDALLNTSNYTVMLRRKKYRLKKAFKNCLLLNQNKMKIKILTIGLLVINACIGLWGAVYLMSYSGRQENRIGECIGYGIVLSVCIYSFNKIVLSIIQNTKK